MDVSKLIPPLFPLHLVGVPNGYSFGMFSRSGQPIDSAWPLIAMAGVRDVLAFNTAPKDQSAQRKLIEAAGMTVAFYEWNGILPPPVSSMEEAIERTRAAIVAGRKVHGHCTRGIDRSGAWAACCRMEFHNWDLDDALHEELLGLRWGIPREPEYVTVTVQWARAHGKV